MLCRVALGKVMETKPDSRCEEWIKGTDGHCVTGVADGSNQEFIVFDTQQVYPEYIMFYSQPGGEPPDCCLQ